MRVPLIQIIRGIKIQIITAEEVTMPTEDLKTSIKKQIKMIQCDGGKPPFVVYFKSQIMVDTPLEAVLLPIRQIYLDLLGFAF